MVLTLPSATAFLGRDKKDSIDRPEDLGLASYPGFDLLRFVLASTVVISHGGVWLPTAFNGGMAVKVFFALSGWLIGGILLRIGPAELPRFFFNRATRIWIPYALAIILLYGVAMMKEGIGFFWFKYLLFDITFTHQLYTVFPAALFEMPMQGSGNQFWSLSVEEQFYLLAPIVTAFLPWGKSIRVWLPIAIVTVALDWNAGSVALGVCAAILERDFAISRRAAVRVAAIILGVLCLGAMQMTGDVYLAGPLFAVSVVVALAVPGRRSALVRVMGGLSYPLYLNHWISAFAVHFLEKRWHPLSLPVYLIVYYLLAVFLGWALYWLVDRNVHIHRSSWYTPSLGRRLGVTAYGLVATGLLLGGAIQLYGPHGTVPPGYHETGQ